MPEIIDVARLEEARIALTFSEIATERRPLGGGTAGRGHRGSWMNKVVGAGMSGLVSREELADVTEWYTSAGITPRVEVCPYGDGSLIEGLAALRYVPHSFGNVLFRLLAPGDEFAAPAPRAAGLRVERINPADARAVRAYSQTVAPQFFPAGTAPTEDDLEVSDRCIRHPRSVALAARIDGRIVGGGGMELHGELATLFGLAVVPEYRRRGIQQALIAERLRIARDHGARIATIGSAPGHATERNVRRMGFQTAYTKIILARPGEGLGLAPG